MSSNELYQAVPLGSEDIRLVTLLPGRRKDFIACELERKFLPRERGHSEKPNYTTLSYMWGNPRNPKCIQCNGFRLSVTRNLYSALLHLRDEHSKKVFWIDAICIDQSSIDERNRQLQRMREIYSQSAQTVTWLGDGSFFSRQGFKVTSILADIMLRRATPRPPSTSWLRRGVEILLYPVYILVFMILLRRPYFTRIWIVQEVALSRNLVVACGDDTISFSDLALVAGIVSFWSEGKNVRNLSNILMVRALMPNAIQNGTADPSWLFAKVTNGTMKIDKDLLSFASLFRGNNSTDPKDKIYALLGLLEEVEGSETYEITLDYNLAVKQVYIQIAEAILKHQRHLDLFGAIRYSPSRMRWKRHGLPSWVPDWSDTTSIATPLSARLSNNHSSAGNTTHEFTITNER
jgi:Heterokaryon incompatibility protein (HET)